MYALVEFAGKQFKIEEGAQIKVPFLTEKIGSKVSLNKIRITKISKIVFKLLNYVKDIVLRLINI